MDSLVYSILVFVSALGLLSIMMLYNFLKLRAYRKLLKKDETEI